MRPLHKTLVALLLTLLITGCGTVPPHQALPDTFKGMATVKGYPADIRSWGDEAGANLDAAIALRVDAYKKLHAAEYARDKKYPVMSYLAISGGSNNGAFGAGIVSGWTQARNRPEFSVVTGTSTGALIAPFAFLGPEHDGTLKEVFTTLNSSNIYSGGVWTMLDGVTGGLALADNTPLMQQIERTITPALFAQIAEEHQKGRRLYIGTSNLEAQRSVIWDIGAIANSGNPDALALFHKIMLASAAVPGVFKPVFINVKVGDKIYQEIHADGGVTAQVFLFPLQTHRADHDLFLENKIDRKLYIIRNNKIMPEYKPMDPGFFAVSARSLETLIKYQGIGDLYRLYIGAQRDGVDYNLIHIPSDFREESQEIFDPVYMGALYDVGFALGRAGDMWEKYPPGVPYMD